MAVNDDHLARSLASFFLELARLKALRRQGWLDREVRDPESVADHAFRMAMMAWLLAEEQGLDVGRAIRLALVHDLPEVHAGDVTPFDGLLDAKGIDRRALLSRLPERSPSEAAEFKARKRANEEAALRDLVAALPEAVREQILNLWLEYEDATTPEARLVRQIDKLETWMQARQYQAIQPEITIESFRGEVARLVADPLLRRIRDALG